MIFTKRSIIGLEMDSREIRAVELSGTQNEPAVKAWGRIRIPEGVVSEGRVVDSALFSAHLQKLISENGFRARDVILGVNNQDIIIRFAAFPKVPEKNIKSMIQFQAQKFIPVPLEELELDYIVLGENKGDDGDILNILLVGARKKMLNDVIDAFKKVRLNINEIDSTMLALGRSALIESHDGTFALAGYNNDIGNILIFKDGLLGIARSFSITQSPAWMAYKNTENQSPEQDMSVIADILFSEIRLSVNYFKMQRNETINNLFVLGHNGMHSQVAARLSETTGLSVNVPNPYQKLNEKAGKNKKEIFRAFDYNACISLAMRGLRV